MLTWCDTMDDFTKLVHERGFIVARSTSYYRLIPRRGNSIDGRKHVSTRTIPVKLYKPQKDEHQRHISFRFCLAEARLNRQFAAILGIPYPPNQHITFIPISSFHTNTSTQSLASTIKCIWDWTNNNTIDIVSILSFCNK